jgi:hypothetical protein
MLNAHPGFGSTDVFIGGDLPRFGLVLNHAPNREFFSCSCPRSAPFRFPLEEKMRGTLDHGGCNVNRFVVITPPEGAVGIRGSVIGSGPSSDAQVPVLARVNLGSLLKVTL